MTTPIQAKVYSNDGKLFTGMTLQDVKGDDKALALFNFADRDGNAKISDDEMVRYNNPILVKNKETNEVRIIEKPSENTLDIQENEVDFYVGQKAENLEKEARKAFLSIDINNDGQISKEELAEVIKLEKKINELKQDFEKKRDINDFMTGLGTMTGTGFSCWGGLVLGFVISNPILAILAGAGVAVTGTALSLGSMGMVRENKEEKFSQPLQELAGMKEENKEEIHPYIQERVNEILTNK